MVFAAPLWLLAFIPWAGAALWLLWGRRRKTPVPFLELWRGPALQKPAKRALQPPSIFLAFALIALALALLAAAQPRLAGAHSGSGKAVTIIIDRGITMSAMPGGVPRFQSAAKTAAEAISPLLGNSTPVDLIVLPGGQSQPSEIGGWFSNLKGLAPTAVDTQASLEETVRSRLAGTSGSVVFVSDRTLAFDDPRLIQFASQTPVENVGIVRLSARETPIPQIMVRVRNDSDRRSVPLKINSETQVVSQNIELPPRGQERDYFVAMAQFGATVEAALDVHDDQSADDRAWLVREGSAPKIEPRAALSPQLRRIVDVFTRQRPPTQYSQIVAIMGDDRDLAGQTPAVLIPPAVGLIAKGQAIAVAHPVTAKIDFSAFPAEVQTAGDFPKGWTPIVRIGDRVIVAAQADPTRKVWVGFDAPGWSSTTDFVVFWANVLTWVGHGEGRFISYPLADYDGPWTPIERSPLDPPPAAGQWPGLYKEPEGGLRAFAAPVFAVNASQKITPDWKERLESAQLADISAQKGIELSPWALIGALACLIGAVATWKRLRLPVFARET